MHIPPIYPFIDIEASGFSSASYPIEVGLIMTGGETFCTLIRPEADWTHWDHEAEKIHHITRKTLLEFGRAASQVTAELNARLGGMTVYTDAWYHDYNWLNRLYDAAGCSPNFRLEDLRSLLTEADQAIWHETKNQVLLDLDLQRHRASNDARVLQTTLQRVKQTLAERHIA